MLPRFESLDKSRLLRIARGTLDLLKATNAQAQLEKMLEEPDFLSGPLIEPFPCFVTLNSQSGRLRGCIGSLATSEPLYENVIYFTRAAALDDPRFEPVTPNETQQLLIQLSVLGPLVPLAKIESLKLGEQGLVVSSNGRRGVLLANVATEHQWDRQTFLEQTCLKAGLRPELASQYQVSCFDQIYFGESLNRVP